MGNFYLPSGEGLCRRQEVRVCVNLQKLLKNIYSKSIPDVFKDLEIKAIHCDSRKVEQGSLFVACQGRECDGEDFIEEAIKKGAGVIFSRKKYENLLVCCLSVEDTHQFLRNVTKHFYGDFSKKIGSIGITGTNGKTTVCYLLDSILAENKKQCGIIGTIHHRIGKNIFVAQNTTPGFLENQKFLASMIEENMDYSLMEVSSHALDQGRVDGIDFRQGIFTNLTDEHLDYHQTKEDYFFAKSHLFTGLSHTATAIMNIDDEHGKRMINKIVGNVMTYGIKNRADVMAKNIQSSIEETLFILTSSSGEIEIQTSLIGLYNVYNILAAAASSLAEGVDLEIIQKGIKNLACVPGRLERVDFSQPYTIFIDYAHTEDALANVLQSIKRVSASRIILVFGCGGDRDKTKRAPMGHVAEQLADVAIITSDNPRGEKPQVIIEEIIQGFEKDNYCIIENREKAIKKALDMAEKDDIVLITGKGHESYQVIGNQKIPFNERAIIKQCLR